MRISILFNVFLIMFFQCSGAVEKTKPELEKKETPTVITMEDFLFNKIDSVADKWLKTWGIDSNGFVLSVAEEKVLNWKKDASCKGVFLYDSLPQLGDTLLIDMYTENILITERKDSLFASFDVDMSVFLKNCRDTLRCKIAHASGYETIEDCMFLSADSIIILGYSGYSGDRVMPFIQLIDLHYRQSKRYDWVGREFVDRDLYFFLKFQNVYPFIE